MPRQSGSSVISPTPAALSDVPAPASLPVRGPVLFSVMIAGTDAHPLRGFAQEEGRTRQRPGEAPSPATLPEGSAVKRHHAGTSQLHNHQTRA